MDHVGRGSLRQLAFVSLAPMIARVLENRFFFTTPHDPMLRRPTKDQTRRRPVSDGLVGDSREGGGSANAAGLMIVLVPTKMGGSGHYEWPSVRVRGRRREKVECGARQCLDIVVVESGWNRPQNWCERPGLGGSSARWLGGLTARQLTGPVAEAPYAGVRRDAGSNH